MKAKLAVRQPATAKVQRQTASVALARKPAAEPALRIIDGGLDGSSLLRLQAAAGNQAVGELIAQPPLSIQAFSLATLVRPAEFAAGASAAVGDAAGKEPDKEPTPAEMGEELKPKSGEAAAASAKADESAARTAAEVGDAAAAKAPATPQAPAKTPKAGPTAGGDGAAPGAGAAPEAEVEAESAPQPAVDAGGAAGAGASRPADPRDDPRFAALAGRVGAVAGKQKSHPPARAKVAETENAAKGPGNEVASKAAANKVEEMGAQKPKGFDKPAFIAAVHAAIEKKSPKNMTEVRDFKDSGKAAEIKSEVAGSVAAGKEAAAGDVKASAQGPPNPAG